MEPRPLGRRADQDQVDEIDEVDSGGRDEGGPRTRGCAASALVVLLVLVLVVPAFDHPDELFINRIAELVVLGEQAA